MVHTGTAILSTQAGTPQLVQTGYQLVQTGYQLQNQGPDMVSQENYKVTWTFSSIDFF